MRDLNKALIESYKLVTARNDYGIYGQRLIISLVEMANNAGYHKGFDFSGNDGIKVIDHEVFGRDLDFSIPLSKLYTSSEEFSYVKKALKKLMTQVMECRDENGNWRMFPILKDVVFRKGVARVQVKELFMDALLDMTQGYRRYELDIIYKLRNVYSIKMFKFLSGECTPQTFTIEEIRKFLLGPEPASYSKYKTSHLFVTKVIEVAKAELDSCSPYTFEYELSFKETNTRGRKPISAITIFPVHQLRYEDVKLKKASHSIFLSSLSKQEQDLFMNKLGFTKEAIQNNLPLIELAKKNLNLLKLLDRVALYVSKMRPRNTIAYTIGSIKLELDALEINFDQED